MDYSKEFYNERNLVLAEDCIKQLRALVNFLEKLKTFVRSSMGRLFKRDIIDVALPIFMMKAKELSCLAEDALAATDSGKAALQLTELKNINASFETYAKSLRTLILTEPTEVEELDLSEKRRFRR